ncbi:TPA: hypothetical protein R1890_000392 [Klebsiella oxytoca]|nr:hypothetical protein [Klebsiella oxytoca]
MGAISAGSVNFERQTIIKVAGYRTTCHCNTNQHAIDFQPNTEFVA